MLVDDTSADEAAKDVPEVDDASVAGTAEEGFGAVEVGAASVIGWASVVETDKVGSELVGVELAAAVDGEMPARVDE